MLTDKTLGQVAYEAYRRRLLRYPRRGTDLPLPWAQAPLREQEAWLEAARAVRDALTREGAQP